MTCIHAHTLTHTEKVKKVNRWMILAPRRVAMSKVTAVSAKVTSVRTKVIVGPHLATYLAANPRSHPEGGSPGQETALDRNSLQPD